MVSWFTWISFMIEDLLVSIYRLLNYKCLSNFNIKIAISQCLKELARLNICCKLSL